MLITVSFNKQMEDGSFKKVSPKFLHRADGFTESEVGITTYLEPYVRGNFVIKSISRESVEEVLYGDSDNWFKIGVELLRMTEDEKVKKEPLTFYVNADTSAAAIDKLIEESLDKFMVDWEIVSVVKSKVIEVVERDSQELPQGVRFEEAGGE